MPESRRQCRPWPRSFFSSRYSSPSVSLFDLTAAVDDQRHSLAVLHRLGGDAFGGRLDVADLRVAGRLDPGDEFLLRQSVRARQPARDREQQDRAEDCSCSHDRFSWSCPAPGEVSFAIFPYAMPTRRKRLRASMRTAIRRARTPRREVEPVRRMKSGMYDDMLRPW